MPPVAIRNRRVAFLFMLLTSAFAFVSGWNGLDSFGSEVTQLDRGLVVAFAAGLLVAPSCDFVAREGESSPNVATDWRELARGSRPAGRAVSMVWMCARVGRYSFIGAILILPVLVIRIAWIKSRIP